jgi:predicted nucleotidyltransferase
MKKEDKSYVRRGFKEGKLHSEFEFAALTSYEVIMGSFAYGVSSDTSDVDLYAVSIPPNSVLYPHTAGYVYGLLEHPPVFEVINKHHVEMGAKVVDFNIYGIVKYFNLCADNNPNMLDSLFVPDRCIIFADDAGMHLRNNRHAFLHKGAYVKYRGYFFQQLTKLVNGQLSKASRQELVEKYGFDTKFAYHIVRLALQVEELLTTGDMDLERNKEVLKSIRKGAWTKQELLDWAKNKEAELDKLYLNSTGVLPEKRDNSKLKKLFNEIVEIKNGKVQGSYVGISEDDLKKINLYDKISALVQRE